VKVLISLKNVGPVVLALILYHKQELSEDKELFFYLVDYAETWYFIIVKY
jgi:hypothetical protein